MFKDLVKIYQKTVNLNFRFDFPKKKKILVFDEVGSHIFKKIIKKNFNILKVRDDREIYFWILLKQIIFLDFKFFTYCKNYINFTSPKIVITFIDNRIMFYELKNNFRNIKFVSVQNGHRTKISFKDKIKHLNKKNLNCDHFFVYNKYYKEKFSKFIKSKFHIVGNIKNNFVSIDNSKLNNHFLYISAYRKNNKKRMKLEKKILGLINLYLSSTNRQLHILTRTKNYFEQREEIEYFKKIYKSSCVFPKTTGWEKTYKIIDRYENIIFIFSSLGYEAIAREKKVVIFPTKTENHLNEYVILNASERKRLNFFRVNKFTYKETRRVLNNISKCSYNVWKKKYFSVIKDQLYFDKNNTKFKKVLSKILKNSN